MVSIKVKILHANLPTGSGVGGYSDSRSDVGAGGKVILVTFLTLRISHLSQIVTAERVRFFQK
jgi:hypothetical protein